MNAIRPSRLPGVFALAAVSLLALALWPSLAAGVVGANKTPAHIVQGGPVDYLVQIVPGTDAATVAAAAGFDVVGQSLVDPSWYYLKPRTEMAADEAVGILQGQAGIFFAAPDGRGTLVRMGFVPNDPYFVSGGGGTANPGQWNLYNSHWAGLDCNLKPAWARGVTGEGVTIGIVDDSLEKSHPDLAPNFSAPLSWNFGQNNADPSPVTATDGHGTSVAGIAAARGGNGIGITGTAPLANLAGLRVDFNNATVLGQNIIDATLYRNDAIKVKNHSYGEQAPFVDDSALVLASRRSADAGVINSRAAGNERDLWGTLTDGTEVFLNWGNANLKSLQNDRKALAVSALGSEGRYAYYSNYGACIFATAPSSSYNGLYRIPATDRTGAAGYNSGGDPGFPDADYMVNFGGTSAVAPLASGVAAMMLQVNPRLDIRGIKHILARTSVKVDPTDQGWITNGAGYHFNPNYGFGLIDADAATRLAAVFTQSPEEVVYSTGTVHVGATILDDVPVGVVRRFHMSGAVPLETVELAVDITHNYPGDLYIRLTSPMGTNSELMWDHTYLDHMMTGLEWTFSSAAFWGEDVTGDWTVQVADRWEGEAGLWNSFDFTAYAGTPEPATLGLLAAGAALAALRRRRAAGSAASSSR